MKTESEQIDSVIEWLESVKSRPRMYFGDKSYARSAESFLWGVQQSVFLLLGLDFYRRVTLLDEAVRKRGQKYSPRGVVTELLNKGLTEEQAVAELLEIEIEFWRITRKEIEEHLSI